MKRILSAIAILSLAVSCDKCDCVPQEPYDDTQIKEAIKDLQDRVSQLESKVAENVAALQSMISLGSIRSCEFDSQTGKAVITLADGKKITVDLTVKGMSLMTVLKDSHGKYYWAVCTDGKSTFLEIEGKKVPVAVTPALKISEQNEWLISVDGGATWVSTGIYQQVSSGDAVPGNPGTPENPSAPMFFTDVKVEGNMLVLTLADGNVIKVAITGEAVFESETDTLWFARESVQKTAALKMNNLKAFTITEKPEGWTASVQSDTTLLVTSPADITLAPRSGAVKILGLFEGGSNPEIVTVELVYEEAVTLAPAVGTEVSVVLSDHALEDVEGYVIGAWKASDFSKEAVAQWLNTEEGYLSECYSVSRNFDIAELVQEYDPTEAYVVFATVHLPVMQLISGSMKYESDDIQSVKIGSTQAQFGFSDIYFDSANLYLELKDIPEYYGGFAELGFWEAVEKENTLKSITQENLPKQTVNTYEGPANGFPDGVINSSILPGKDYIVWIMPCSESNVYDEKDFITYSFSTPGVSADPSIAAPSYVVTERTFGGFTAEVTPASEVYKTYAAIRKGTAIPEDEMTCVLELIDIDKHSLGSEKFEVTSNSFSADEEAYLVAVSVSRDGKYGKLLKEKVELKKMEYTDAVSVEVANIEYGVGDVTLMLKFNGNPATISYYCSSSVYYSDDVVQDYLAKGQLGDSVNDKQISTLLNGHQIYFEGLTLNVEYTFYALVKDADGNPSRVCKTTFIPTASQVDYILNTDPEYTYGMPQLSGKRVLTKYTLSVQKPDECVKYWLFKGDPEYFTGDVWIDTDKLVTMQLELSGETVHTEPNETITYTNVNSMTRIYMAWLDDKGRYHAIYEFNPNTNK